MIHKTIKAAIIQYNCSQDKQESIGRLLEIVTAAATDADIVLLAELVFTPYTTNPDFATVAEPIPGNFSAQLGQIAREKNAYICSGVVERDGEAIYNTSILIDPNGEIVSKYRKTGLADGDVRGGFRAGTGPQVVQTPMGRVAMLICWDTRNIDLVSALVKQKPDLLLVPCYGLAKVDHSREEFIDCMVDECIDEWRLRMQVLAKLCNCYVLRADHCGMEERQVRVGHSIAVAPGGYVIAEATMKPATLEVLLKPDSNEQNKFVVPYID